MQVRDIYHVPIICSEFLMSLYINLIEICQGLHNHQVRTYSNSVHLALSFSILWILTAPCSDSCASGSGYIIYQLSQSYNNIVSFAQVASDCR